jgi:hypothetical protein
VADHVTDIADADPGDRDMLLFGGFWDRATRFGDNQERAFNNVLSAPVFGELLESQRPRLFGDTIHRDDHVVERC